MKKYFKEHFEHITWNHPLEHHERKGENYYMWINSETGDGSYLVTDVDENKPIMLSVYETWDDKKHEDANDNWFGQIHFANFANFKDGKIAKYSEKRGTDKRMRKVFNELMEGVTEIK